MCGRMKQPSVTATLKGEQESEGVRMQMQFQVEFYDTEDPVFTKAYEEIRPEMNVIRAMIEARTPQNLTQKQLAEKTGIAQTEISRLENGTRNPGIKLLQRLAEGMGLIAKNRGGNKYMKLTSAMAAKELKKLNEKHEALLSMEDKASMFVAAIQEDIETVRPEYSYVDVQAA